MKKLVFIFFLLMLAARPAICQADRTFHRLCQSSSVEIYEPFRQDQIKVKNFSDDSITFESTKAAASHTYAAKKVSSNIFMESGDTGDDHFYAYKVDDNSFYLMSYFTGADGYGAFAYYRSDGQLDNEEDLNKRCPNDALALFGNAVKPYQAAADTRNKELADKASAEHYQGILNDFLKNLRSRRTDPALEKGITAWWKNAVDSPVDPKLRFYFLMPNYDIIRNGLGEVLRKQIDVLMVQKENDGICSMSWRTFGYESLGGGTFDTELKNWVRRLPNTGELQAIILPERYELETTHTYRVRCP